MIFGDRLLKELLEDGRIRNSYEGAVNPASINVRLGDTFLIPKKDQHIRLGDEVFYDRIQAESYEILPGEFLLATTIEEFDIPKYAAAFVQGRSSIGRAGLTVQNAGFVDPGFTGCITLELKNDAPFNIVVRAGYPVAQLVFMDASDVSFCYKGKYVGQIEATGSRMHRDDLEMIFANYRR